MENLMGGGTWVFHPAENLGAAVLRVGFVEGGARATERHSEAVSSVQNDADIADAPTELRWCVGF